MNSFFQLGSTVDGAFEQLCEHLTKNGWTVDVTYRMGTGVIYITLDNSSQAAPNHTFYWCAFHPDHVELEDVNKAIGEFVKGKKLTYGEFREMLERFVDAGV